ncbi:insulinase family protein [Eikenella sp. S3360]|uniref:Insulinase family protein n=1 Tax=Eikenella glucosivorans TaxID=2766967 RepID=A0ABS0N7D9_9NEIS|nr:pitrilysin family protein [Eikenella glucosivorans]MBH5328184.1 insulinase family protein [Eikenella glucosivorans]
MKPFFRILLLACLLPAAALAEDIPIQRWQTADGTKVLLVERHENPIVDIDVAFDAGNSRDSANKIGVADFAAGLMDTGTQNLNEEALLGRVADLAVSLSSYGGTDSSGVRLRSLAKGDILNPALDLMRDVLAEPRFDPAVLKREQDRAVENLKQNRTQPAFVASIANTRQTYPSHPYGYPARTSEQSIRRITPADLHRFHRQYFTRRNAVVAIVGDVSRSQAEEIVGRLTGGLPPGERPAPLPAAGNPAAAPTRTLPHSGSQAHIVLGMPLISRNDPDFYALTVGNYILGGGGFDSRLMKVLRDQHGYTYGASSRLNPLRANGPFTLSFATEKNNARAALAATQQVLRDFAAHGPTEAEMAQAKANLVGSFPLRFDTNAELAGYLKIIGLYDLPSDYLSQYPAAISRLSAQDVKAAWQRRVHGLHSVVVGMPSAGKPAAAPRRTHGRRR